MKPRVLIYRSDLLPQSETFIAAQAQRLARYDPVFAGLRRHPSSLPLPAGQVVCPRFPYGFQRLAGRTPYAPGLRKAAQAQRPALIHAHFALDAAESLALRRDLGVPLVVTLHGYDVMCADEAHRQTRRGRLYLRRRTQLWSEATLFVCVSNAIRDRALSLGFPAGKLRVAPIGVDTDLLAPSGALTTDPTVLFVGRLVPKKGCDLLIEAFAHVQARLPEARLLIAGDGPDRRLLERLASSRTIGTEFLGMQTPKETATLMRNARCLAAPSMTAANGDAEGLPIVLCEALALGVPVASTRHSGIPELIGHREQGLLSEEADVEGLAAHLLELLTDDALAVRLRKAGRARVEQCFDLRRQTQALEQLYDEACEAGQQAPRRLYGFSPPAEVPGTLERETRPISQDRKQRGRTLQMPSRRPALTAAPAEAGAVTAGKSNRLRYQVAWMLSGSGAATLFQALYFLLIGRMLGSGEYGAFAGVVALVNVLSQFSSLGMEMVLLRTVARDRAAFAVTWARSLAISLCGFSILLPALLLYGHFFLSPPLRHLLPYLAVSDALFGKLTQLGSRALQGADLARWSAKLLALTNAARAAAAAGLFLWAFQTHTHVSVLFWARVYAVSSLLVALAGLGLVTHLLGWPQWRPIRRQDLSEGLSFSFSSSAISVYNDIDKAVLVSYGFLAEAGIYAAAYRVVDVLSTPIISLFGAASPRLFREGQAGGPPAAERGARSLLRWALPFGLLAVPLLAGSAPLLPRLFGHSFAASIAALRFLCLLPLLRALHYAWGTAITACASQWLRTAAQAGVAILNLLLNLVLIPRWGWRGAAFASLVTDGSLALATWIILRVLVSRSTRATSGRNTKGRWWRAVVLQIKSPARLHSFRQ